MRRRVCAVADFAHKPFVCAEEPDVLSPLNGVTRTYFFMGCGETAVHSCAAQDGAGTLSDPARTPIEGHVRAPYMCLQMRPVDHPYRVTCTCWQRSGGEAVEHVEEVRMLCVHGCWPCFTTLTVLLPYLTRPWTPPTCATWLESASCFPTAAVSPRPVSLSHTPLSPQVRSLRQRRSDARHAQVLHGAGVWLLGFVRRHVVPSARQHRVPVLLRPSQPAVARGAAAPGWPRRRDKLQRAPPGQRRPVRHELFPERPV